MYTITYTLSLEELWHNVRAQISCQLFNVFSKILTIIPHEIENRFKSKPTFFSRTPVLTFPRLITFLLSIVSNGKSDGVAIKIDDFFSHAKKLGLWLDITSIGRSAISKARNKIKWEAFRNILKKSTTIAYECWQDTPSDTWHDLSVYAIDGSYHTLPATLKIRDAFDPSSGFDKKGKGHYPQCLVTLAFDVLRKIPIDLTVTSIHSDETAQATQQLIPSIPAGGVLLFDRGYQGYQFIDSVANYDGYFVLRNKSTCTFKVVEDFIKSNKAQDQIVFKPNERYLYKSAGKTFYSHEITLRIIRIENKEGETSVLITNLLDSKRYTMKAIIDLYFMRWEIETFYRDNKCTIEIEQFHSKSVNGIQQEFYAAAIMSLISRIAMNCTRLFDEIKNVAPQFKNALRKMSNNAALLVSNNALIAYSYFLEILEQINRVKYYKPKEKRPSQIRICKKEQNKWILNRMRIKCQF